MAEPYSQETFLKDLSEELHSVKAKWKNIGIQLEVPWSELNNIDEKHKNPELAFLEMVNEWLKRMVDRSPSWVDIVKVLCTRSVGEYRLGRSLKHRRCIGAEVMPTAGPGEDMSDEDVAEFPMLKNYKWEEVPPAVQGGIKKLSKSFNSLRIATFRYIMEDQERVKLDDFRVFVCNPEYLLVHNDHRELRQAKSTSEICIILSQKQYLNWHHYDLLEEIIQEYGDPTLKGLLEEYCKEIESFEEKIGLNDVNNIIFTPCPRRCCLIKVPIPNELEGPSLSTMRSIQAAVKRRNGFSSPVHHVGQNSPLAIYFIVPQLLVQPTLKEELTAINSDTTENPVVMTFSKEWVLQLFDLQPCQPSASEATHAQPPSPTFNNNRTTLKSSMKGDEEEEEGVQLVSTHSDADESDTESEYEIIYLEELPSPPTKKRKINPEAKISKKKGKMPPYARTRNIQRPVY